MKPSKQAEKPGRQHDRLLELFKAKGFGVPLLQTNPLQLAETQSDNAEEHRESLKAILGLWLIHALGDAVHVWNVNLATCESPIERQFLVGLYAVVTANTLGDVEIVRPGLTPPGPRPALLCVYPQFRIDKYRVDFRLDYSEWAPDFNNKEIARDGTEIPGCALETKTVLVECDGHDYHERTKQQAKHDRSKDRRLLALGYRVHRFTGSEIWKDPVACAAETMGLLTDEAIEDLVT